MTEATKGKNKLTDITESTRAHKLIHGGCYTEKPVDADDRGFSRFPKITIAEMEAIAFKVNVITKTKN